MELETNGSHMSQLQSQLPALRLAGEKTTPGPLLVDEVEAFLGEAYTSWTFDGACALVLSELCLHGTRLLTSLQCLLAYVTNAIGITVYHLLAKRIVLLIVSAAQLLSWRRSPRGMR
jgi:hypothetical protein